MSGQDLSKSDGGCRATGRASCRSLQDVLQDAARHPARRRFYRGFPCKTLTKQGKYFSSPTLFLVQITSCREILGESNVLQGVLQDVLQGLAGITNTLRLRKVSPWSSGITPRHRSCPVRSQGLSHVNRHSLVPPSPFQTNVAWHPRNMAPWPSVVDQHCVHHRAEHRLQTFQHWKRGMG